MGFLAAREPSRRSSTAARTTVYNGRTIPLPTVLADSLRRVGKLCARRQGLVPATKNVQLARQVVQSPVPRISTAITSRAVAGKFVSWAAVNTSSPPVRIGLPTPSFAARLEQRVLFRAARPSPGGSCSSLAQQLMRAGLVRAHHTAGGEVHLPHPLPIQCTTPEYLFPARCLIGQSPRRRVDVGAVPPSRCVSVAMYPTCRDALRRANRRTHANHGRKWHLTRKPSQRQKES